jgi:hypothetical protein
VFVDQSTRMIVLPGLRSDVRERTVARPIGEPEDALADAQSGGAVPKLLGAGGALST